ncbi:hypothetical protein N7537_008264 [Penicillium hordei]|uniref:RING-type domain-containing protein n=1 Tax=Penicillium hordei TaxID=40994 RepID=A0AAD6E0G8_9EURO|nr:uncharacterized protein N7537_008264 [Penicillium hordei]KAJ5598180.1 hypothetical protein N7537_008264 [Penicillium hordei]
MPSRYSHVATFPMAPLSDIIKLEPEEEPWCAGYAPSQGRRCHMRTNARGRRSARMLLNEGTKDLRAGRNIDILLEDLAPHVLCTRFHQNQASDLVRRWKRRVNTYLDSQIVSTPYTRPVRTSSRMISETAVVDLEERVAVLHQRLREAKEEVRRLEIAQSVLPTTANTRHREGRNTGAVVNSSSRGTASSGNPPVNRVNETLRRDSTASSTNQSPIPAPRPAQARVSHQTIAIFVSSSRLVNTPTVARASSRIGNTVSQDETPQPIRREVEGECGICLCDLHRSQDENSDEEKTESGGGDDHDDSDDSDDGDDSDDSDDEDDSDVSDDENDYDDSDDENDYDDSDDDTDADDDDTDDHGHLEELVWCRARCGVNFHKQCIDQWLETDHASTCPTCRSNWKH